MEYITVIGLEMHAEMKSKSKVFSKAINSYNDLPNENIMPLDMAFPGTLPILNIECVKKAIEMALILKCKVPDIMLFDRKNYYYPDLPKGYQITQNTKPIGTGGLIKIDREDSSFDVTIQDIHLEEDSASLDHLYDTSVIDYNRSGVPLLEVVTNPCIYSANDAVLFLETMRNIYKYTDISEADTKKGQIRCDVNINLKDPITNKYLTPKVEIKNINSFANVESAIIYEVERQTKALNNKNVEELVQETRRYDEETNTTIRMRTKVDAIDYKYFIEPNIPPFIITKEMINECFNKIPVLASDRKKNYINNLGLSLIDSTVLVKDKNVSDYFEECLELGMNPKEASNWVTGIILAYLNKNNISIKDLFITPKMLKDILESLNNKTISSKQAKEIFYNSLENKKEPKEYLSNNNISQISNENELLNIIINILDNNKQNIIDYKNGKDNIFQFFVGQVMKETKGKANPELTRDILNTEIKKR